MAKFGVKNQLNIAVTLQEMKINMMTRSISFSSIPPYIDYQTLRMKQEQKTGSETNGHLTLIYYSSY
jgi:hypothetical protein